MSGHRTLEYTRRAIDAARTVTTRNHITKQPGQVSISDMVARTGLSHTSIGDASRLLKQSTPEVVAAVYGGRITIFAALKMIRVGGSDQNESLDAVAGKVSASNHQSVSALLGKPVERRTPTAAPSKRMDTTLESLAAVAQDLEMFSEDVKETWQTRWDTAIWDVQRTLLRVQTLKGKEQ